MKDYHLSLMQSFAVSLRLKYSFISQEQQQTFAHRYTAEGHLVNKILPLLIVELLTRHWAEILITLSFTVTLLRFPKSTHELF